MPHCWSFNYVRGIEDRANNNAKRVDVYVAKTDIPRGTPGETAASDGAVGIAQIPQEFRPASAITTTDEIQKKVALFNIPQNTPIVQDMFVDPAQTQISFRERLKNPDARGHHGLGRPGARRRRLPGAR